MPLRWRVRRPSKTAVRRRVHPCRGVRRAGHRRAREPAAGLTGAGRRLHARDTLLGARPRAATGSLASRHACGHVTSDRGPPARPNPPALYKHAPNASPQPFRAASTPSRPARELERPATAVPVPSRGSHPGTRCRPRSPRAPRAAQTLQTTQLRVFPVFFSKVRPIPHPRSPQRVRARCCVRLEKRSSGCERRVLT